MAPFERGLAWGGFWLTLFGVAEGAPRFLRAIKVRLPKLFTNPFRAPIPPLPEAGEAPMLGGLPEGPIVPETPRIGFRLPHQDVPALEIPKAPVAPKPRKIGFELPHDNLPSADLPPMEKPGRIGFELPHEKPPGAHLPAAPKPRRIGFQSAAGRAAELEGTSSALEPPSMSANPPEPSGVISQMPSAKGMPPKGAGGAIGSPESPRAALGDASAGVPTKGSVVSSVGPESAPAALSDATEARLADERAVQTARAKRISAQERVNALSEKVDDLKKMREELGAKTKRDYIDDAHDEAVRDLRDAQKELRKSRIAEAEADAAQRIELLRQPEIDPLAGVNDPAVKSKAVAERDLRKASIEQNNKLIKENEQDVVVAKARAARRRKAYNDAPGPANRKAQDALESAERHLQSVKDRTKPAREANQKHYKRLQELDRVINPQDYPQLSGEKGNYGETRAHHHMDAEGYKLQGSSKSPPAGKQPSDQGLDGVYEKRSPAAKGPKHVVGEAKYGQAKLRKGQELPEWVDQRLEQAVGSKRANQMREEGYEYWVLKYDPKARRVISKKLWEFRPSGRKNLYGKPLGTVHYFPIY